MSGNSYPEILNRQNNESGFSLIELMIAMVVLTIGLVSIMGLRHLG